MCQLAILVVQMPMSADGSGEAAKLQNYILPYLFPVMFPVNSAIHDPVPHRRISCRRQGWKGTFTVQRM